MMDPIRPDETPQAYADRLLQDFHDQHRPPPEDQLRREWTDELADLAIIVHTPTFAPRRATPADHQRLHELRTILS